jgi:leucine dehydrogenase
MKFPKERNTMKDDFKMKVSEIHMENYEKIVKIEVEEEFTAYISIHNTYRGPSLGGCRCLFYENNESAFTDALALSRAMTYKSCLADLPFGGGKSVINTPYFRNREKKSSYLKCISHVLNDLNGKYIIAEDMNISCDDLDVVREITPHVVEKIAGDPGPVTAKGVFFGIKEIVPSILGKEPKEISVLVQGIGSVGSSLVSLLVENEFKVYISDINEEVRNKFPQIEFVSSEKIFDFPYDVFSPCARGNVVTRQSVEKMKKNNIKIIAGSANNQLETNSIGWELKNNNIIYLPDFVINAGGVIQVSGSVNGKYHEDVVEKKLKNIPVILKEILEESEKNNVPTNYTAVLLARKKLNIID